MLAGERRYFQDRVNTLKLHINETGFQVLKLFDTFFVAGIFYLFSGKDGRTLGRFRMVEASGVDRESLHGCQGAWHLYDGEQV
jgi:hypothetical protein